MTMTVWTPPSGSGPGMLLIQEIFGVGSYIRAVGERLAAAGYVVGAPDLYWRVAPGYQGAHDEAGLNEAMALAGKLDQAQAIADCGAALDHLAGLPETASARRPGVIGFCLGGTLAFGVAAVDDPAVCVSYYGSGVPDMLDRIPQVTCPTLFHFGTDDPYIPGEKVDALAAALAPHMVLNVELAGHAFDNHDAPMFHDEAAARAAWSKTLAFLAEHHPAG